jgi:hypothetical protein
VNAINNTMKKHGARLLKGIIITAAFGAIVCVVMIIGAMVMCAADASCPFPRWTKRSIVVLTGVAVCYFIGFISEPDQ